MKSLITCLVLCVLNSAVLADTWTVDDDGPADFSTIQAAVNAASDGDEIVVMPGTYTSTSSIAVVNLTYKQTLTIRSQNGPTSTFIDGSNQRRGILLRDNFNPASNITIDGFTIRNCSSSYASGSTGWGGGILCLDIINPTIQNCIFQSNTGGLDNPGSSYAFGGGIATINSSATILNCDFINNHVTGAAWYPAGGAIYSTRLSLGYPEVVITIQDSDFDQNSPVANPYYGYGGAIRGSQVDFQITNCDFTNNFAASGGAIGLFDCVLNLESCNFTQNYATCEAPIIHASTNMKLSISDTNAGYSNYIYGGNPCNSYSFGIVIEGDDLGTGFENSLSFNGQNEISMLYCEEEAEISFFGAPTTIYQALFDSNAIRFDLSQAADHILIASSDLQLVGPLALTDVTNNLDTASIGDIFPLVETSDVLTYDFETTVFPTLPSGLAFQFEDQGIRGTSELNLEVIVGTITDFNDTITDSLSGSIIEMSSFDANGDGKDELAILFDGNPGFVAVYEMDGVSNPSFIDGSLFYFDNSCIDLDTGDLDGDGLDDLVIASSNSNSVGVVTSLIDADGQLAFVQSSEVVANSSQTIQCISLVQWDCDSFTDVVVGVTEAGNSNNDGFQIALDLVGQNTSGPFFSTGQQGLGGNTYVDRIPNTVKGSLTTDCKSAFGFVGGTTYGHIYQGNPNNNNLLLTDVIENQDIIDVDLFDLNDNGGDGYLDIIVISSDRDSIYLLEATNTTSFEDIIELPISIEISDVTQTDADGDGDIDFIVSSESTENSLTLIKNNGHPNALRSSHLRNRTWQKDSMESSGAIAVVAGGSLSPKDDEKDWVVGGNTSSALLGVEESTLELTGIGIEVPIAIVVDQSGGGDYVTIQAAIDAASDGDEIIVMPGTYYGTGMEVINMQGKALWLHSSDGAEDTIINGENSRRVVVCNSKETNETIIEGFTITEGFATGEFPLNCGAGISSLNSSPMIIECVIIDNVAEIHGGGVEFRGLSDPRIIDCTISNNSAGYDGAGILAIDSNTTINDCVISNNTANRWTGGIVCVNGIHTISGCEVTNNSGGYDEAGDPLDGAGMYLSAKEANISETLVCGNTPNQLFGDYIDAGGNTISDECPNECVTDLNDDGNVDVNDLLILIANWGECSEACAGDANDDGNVDVNDLLVLIAAWGPCE